MSQQNVEIEQFIKNIFKELPDNEHILFWGSSKASPGFPQDYDTFFNRTLRSSTPKACYFSTATASLSDDGRLYNRQTLFSRMFCIMLDDIGTGLGSRCTVEDLPKILRDKYSWKLESSPDNYQYVFLLDEPISDLNAAKELVKIIYAAGKWDSGGAMPNKLIRMPCGVNLKKKYMGDDDLFRVSGLSEIDEEDFYTFSPDELLEAVNAGVTWDDIKSGTASKIDPRRTSGTTAWREGKFNSNLNGVVDEVLDWMNDQKLVINENDEWIDIVCPWAESHTDGNTSAGYKPLGYGDNPSKRSFHCFHGHCHDKYTQEFLEWIGAKSGINHPIYDPIPALISKWAFDMCGNNFIDIQSERAMIIPHSGFKAGHQEDVFWRVGDKVQKATKYGLIVKNTGLLKLMGSDYVPGGEYIIEKGNKKYLNEWVLPNWPIKKVSENDDWGKFLEFIKYLMPEGRDAEWFLDHIASKAQSPVYRGPSVILITPVQGSGRGTLGNMLSKLWGMYNVGSVGLSALITGLSGEGFNAWLKNVWLIVPEAKESNSSRKQEARAYESLKTGLDPQPTSHLIKTKYGGEDMTLVYASTLICSNHRDVLNIPPTDRRFFFVDCNVEAGTPDYFTKLNEWLETGWEAGVWAELLKRDISGHKGFAPQSMQRTTELQNDQMLNSISGQSPIDRLVTLTIMFAKEQCGGVICTRTLCSWISTYQFQLGISTIHNWEDIYKRLIQNSTAELKYDNKRRSFKIGATKSFARHTLTKEGYDIKKYITETNDFKKVKSLIEDQNADTFKDFSLNVFNEAGL